MTEKILIPLYGDDVSPRFDLATEVLMAVMDPGGERIEERMVVLPEASAEKLCHLVLTENITVVICGGIEEEYYQYLKWKRVRVLDAVAGAYQSALKRFAEGRLQPGDICH
jgi:predicted Fe-Mo cluster-binding NifX family protein